MTHANIRLNWVLRRVQGSGGSAAECPSMKFVLPWLTWLYSSTSLMWGLQISKNKLVMGLMLIQTSQSKVKEFKLIFPTQYEHMEACFRFFPEVPDGEFHSYSIRDAGSNSSSPV